MDGDRWGRGADDPARPDDLGQPAGGYVERSGFAFLRRGESITVSGEGAATVRNGPGPAADGIVLEIPVTVEIGPTVEEITEAAAELALRRLREALAARTTG
ncbi:hypothetical protein [Raineyella sp. LH-20]|uniref:hypothetical protein n=1 Tax=Raineyella sp. LH-20 TaxID=3081204 RepID=UPI002954E57E|nr:hypothetical protein [Raineyella sp. LH-20]WOP18912.1 hypothetical protein R0146_01150 [Raineyella sp. LH-20]